MDDQHRVGAVTYQERTMRPVPVVARCMRLYIGILATLGMFSYDTYENAVGLRFACSHITYLALLSVAINVTDFCPILLQYNGWSDQGNTVQFL